MLRQIVREAGVSADDSTLLTAGEADIAMRLVRRGLASLDKAQSDLSSCGWVWLWRR
jgi:hypothetical protein